MTRTGFASVDEYLAAQPEAARAVLEKVRAILRKALPGAEETISYQIPTFKIGKRAILYFAAFKDHWSLYPVTSGMEAAFPEEVAERRAGKGTLRFTFDERVPVKLIAGLAKARLGEQR